MTLILSTQYVLGIVLGPVEDTKLRKIQPQGPYHLVGEVSHIYRHKKLKKVQVSKLETIVQGQEHGLFLFRIWHRITAWYIFAEWVNE